MITVPVFAVTTLGPDLLGSDGAGNPARLGAYACAFFLAGALCSPIAGGVVEKFGPQVGGGLSLLAAGAVVAVMWTVAAFPIALTVALVAAGAAYAFAHPVLNTVLVSQASPRRRGLMFGLKQAAAPTSTLVCGLVVMSLRSLAAARLAFAVAGSVLMIVGMRWALYRPQTSPRPRPVDRRSLVVATDAEGQASGVGWSRVVGGGLAAAAGTGIASNFVSISIELGIPANRSAKLLVWASLTCIAVRLVAGWSVDRCRGRPTMPRLREGAMLAVGAMGLPFVLLDSVRLRSVVLILVFAMLWGWPGLYHLSVSEVDVRQAANNSARAQIGLAVGAASGPIVMGHLLDQASIVWAVGGTAVTAGAAAWLLRKSHRRGFTAGIPIYR